MNEFIGRVIAGRYRVETFLGKGGMAEVYKVWDQERNVHLAMKILHADLAEDRVFLRRFKREAQTLAKLQHPNIVRFYGLEQDEDLVYMLMDYVEGTTLRKEIFQAKAPLSVERIVEVMKPICAALYYAHKSGFVHCDMKPANIMIHKNGTVYVADFGIARMTEASTSTMIGAGTPAYMSPEQARGEDPIPQTDIYAMGVVLFEMLTGGERPFTGESAKTTGSTSEKVRWEQMKLAAPPPSKFNSAVSSEMDEIVLKCLEKQPANRYSNATDLLNDLAYKTIQSSPTSQELPKDQSVHSDDLREKLARATAKRAEAILEMGNVDGAITELQSIFDDSPSLIALPYATALIHRGEIREQQGDITGALADYELASSIDSATALSKNLKQRIKGVKQSVKAETSLCPKCGHQIQEDWINCPICGNILKTQHPPLSNNIALPQRELNDTFNSLRSYYIPQINWGSILAFSLIVLLIVWNFLVLDVELQFILGLIIAIAGFILWYFCLYRLHIILAEATNHAYPVSPGKSVWMHFIPIYNFYWLFHWSNQLGEFINTRSDSKLRRGGIGILFLITFTSSAFAFIDTSQVSLSLTVLSFVLMVCFGVLDFFQNQILSILGRGEDEVDSSPERRPWFSELLSRYFLAAWLTAYFLFLVPFFMSSMQFDWPFIFIIFVSGMIQQILLSCRKLIGFWWAVATTLGWVIGLLIAASVPRLAESDLIPAALAGFTVSLFQWLILRRQISKSGWWLLIHGLAVFLIGEVLIKYSGNTQLAFGSILFYAVVTGITLDWLISRKENHSIVFKQYLLFQSLTSRIFIAVFLVLALGFGAYGWDIRQINSTFVEISSTGGWQNQMQVEKGNKIVIQYSDGSWSIDPANTVDGYFTDADGVPGSKPQDWCESCSAPLPSGTLGRLVARIGQSEVLEIGNYNSFIADCTGMLTLTINDIYDSLNDNQGSIQVWITIYNH